jgi:Rad3-related DNA helicase
MSESFCQELSDKKQRSPKIIQRLGISMGDPLATYLHDHLAGANFAVELLENLRQRHSDGETRRRFCRGDIKGKRRRTEKFWKVS